MTQLEISDDGLRFIARWEGVRLAPYNDAAGNATIGYGHLLHVGPVTEHDRMVWRDLNIHHALSLLRVDAGAAAAAVRSFVTPPIVLQTRFDALVSFVFNVGTGAFRHSMLLERLNRGERGELAADELLRWDRAGGRVLAGLQNRRRAERRLYLHGSYDG